MLVVKSMIFWPGVPPTGVARAVAAGVAVTGAAAAVAMVAGRVTSSSRPMSTEPPMATLLNWSPTLEWIEASSLFGSGEDTESAVVELRVEDEVRVGDCKREDRGPVADVLVVGPGDSHPATHGHLGELESDGPEALVIELTRRDEPGVDGIGGEAHSRSREGRAELLDVERPSQLHVQGLCPHLRHIAGGLVLAREDFPRVTEKL